MSLFRWVKQGTHARKAIVFLSLTLWYPVMFWDDILGYWKWRSLCEKEAAIKVYKTVQLSPDQFDQSGMPKSQLVLTPQGAKESRHIITDQIEWRSPRIINYSKWPARVDKYYDYIIDVKTNEMLGESITFSRYRGGPPRPVPDKYGDRCPGQPNDVVRALMQKIFTKN